MRGLTAVLLVVSVAMCLALSKDELEEFTEYLWKTSVLDQNLKDGTNFGHDDDEEVSDHAWEESGKFEGDLILNERQRRLIAEDVAEGLSRNGLRDSTKRWPNNEVVFYIQREHFTGDQVDAIKEGIDDLTRASCIKFRPYKKGDRDAVVIQGSRRGCFSQVGYQGGYQVLNLSGRHPVGRGCFRHGTVVHELLHTLGFYHMQSSHDRDEFINVVWENIVQPARHNFRKYNAFSVSDFGVGYDYDSVLHYSRRAFSANGGDTLVPKQSGAQIGQRVGLSDKDTQKLNKMYCDADANSNAAADEPSKTIKTKKTKNQPFQGHGIGYHQGKTLVIKIPVAKTLKSPDSSSYAVFDYFSKAPQALPPAFVQGFGVGKEIEYRPPVAASNTKKYQQDRAKTEPITQKENSESNPTTTEEFFKSLASSRDVERHPKTHNTNHPLKDKDKVNEDLLEAFERLEKIIRSQVYPKSKSDTAMDNYSELYYPESKEHELKSKKLDEFISHSPKKTEKNETKEKSSDAADKPEQKFNSLSNDNDTDFISPLFNKINEEFDSSFGTSLPFKMPIKETFRLSSKHSEPDDENEFAHGKIYDDYGSLYKPKTKSLRSESQEPYHTLFGDPVPLKENWFKKKPNSDSSEKELDRYGEYIIKNLKPARESNEKYEKSIKDKHLLSIPYEIKYTSKEDSSSGEIPYDEYSAEKPYDKLGYVENPKQQRKENDSSDYYSEYKYPELTGAQFNEKASINENDHMSGEFYSDEPVERTKPNKSSETSNPMVKHKYYKKQDIFEDDKLENDNYSADENDKVKEITLPRNSHGTATISYRVTEEPEENYHEQPAKDDTKVFPKSNEDYDSFGGDIDERLTTILSNYDFKGNLHIDSPYDSHEKSSQSTKL